MNKTIPILLLLLFCARGEAGLKSLAKEFLESNSTVMKSKAQMDSSFLNIASLESQKIWSLSYSGLKEKDNLEQVSAFATRNTSTTTHVLSLGKSFNWGGEFAFNNTLIKYDAPNLSQPSNGFVQGFSYTQDLGANFLGRKFYSDLSSTESSYKASEASLKNTMQTSLLSFATIYSQAKLNQSLFDLQKEALQRAKRRLDLIRKRVRDGLKEKVDLIQARMELLAAEEQVKSFEMRRKVSLEHLSNSLHRDVKRTEVEPFDSTGLDIEKIPTGGIQGNLEVASLERKIESLKFSKSKVDYSFWPTVNAGIEYNVNEYDNTKSTAISDGMLTGDREADETKLSLNLIWTIGNEAQEVERARNNIELRTAQMEKEKISANFSKTEESLLDQIQLLENNLVSVKSRKELANSALVEMTKLYNRGRADLDQVIRAEESLINTERNFVEYLAQRDNLIYSLASLYGDLEGYILK